MNIHHCHKITDEHLNKEALGYMRISDPQAVRNKPDNVARHYTLKQLPIEYGWSPERIIMIEHDLGRSGRFIEGRSGFVWMLRRVLEKRVGAIFCMEAARLARCDLDFAQLVKYCRYTNTLIIDPNGVYDQTEANDRMNLSLKGILGEVEGDAIRARSLAQKLYLAKKGKLHLQLPTGYIYSPAKKVIFDPDEEIQKTFRLFFEQFGELGSISALVRYFHEKCIPFPTRLIGGLKHGEVVWGSLRAFRAKLILANPVYAGTFVYGRRKTVTEAELGDNPKLKTHLVRIKREDWEVVLEGIHEGYITPAQHKKNLEQIEANRKYPSEDPTGKAPHGSALLQKIARCGNCTHKMSVTYPKRFGTARYGCTNVIGRTPTTDSGCYFFYAFPRTGVSVDDVVQRALLQAIDPAQLELSIKSLEQFEERELDIHRLWDTRIRSAEAEATRKRHEFDAVSSENRYVKATLERELNEALAEVERLKLGREETTPTKLRELSSDQQQSILSLARDFALIWNAETTTQAERKSLLRKLIEEVTLFRVDESVHIIIHWVTKATTPIIINLRELDINKYRRTDPAIIEKIRELAPGHTDSEVAQLLNKAGFVGKKGKPFTLIGVMYLRHSYNILGGCPERMRNPSHAAVKGQRGDGRWTLNAAAKEFNVSRNTVSSWCRKGILDGLQVIPGSTWWVKITPEDIEKLKKPEGRYHFPKSPK